MIRGLRAVPLKGDSEVPTTEGVGTKRQREDIPYGISSHWGFSVRTNYEQGMELEVADYLYKPFDNSEFLRIVKKIAFGDNFLLPISGDFRSPSRFDLALATGGQTTAHWLVHSKSGGGLGKILYIFLYRKKTIG